MDWGANARRSFGFCLGLLALSISGCGGDSGPADKDPLTQDPVATVHQAASTIGAPCDSFNSCPACEICVSNRCQARPSGADCPRSEQTCEVLSACDGTGGDCPSKPKAGGKTNLCRASSGDCDVAEYCDGVSLECGTDAVAGADMVCLPSIGPCDLANYCDGQTKGCNKNRRYKGASALCWPTNGPCDEPDYCNEGAATCKTTDRFKPDTSECWPTSGVCDEPDYCTGTDGQCPTADRVKGTSEVCRPNNGPCDVPDNCPGNSKDCSVPDAVKGTNALCWPTNGPCDVADYCSGTTPDCRTVDTFKVSTAECWPTTGVCDVPDFCTGTSGSCQTADTFKASSELCWPTSGVCDQPDYCTGDTGKCQTSDRFRPPTEECWPTLGVCDVPDYCSGISGNCQRPDTFKPDTELCWPTAATCDIADFCTGTNGSCRTTDTVMPAGTICKDSNPSGNVCDPADRCNGSNTLCTPLYASVATACDDGISCTKGDHCSGTGNCVQGAPTPNLCASKPCGVARCDLKLDCQYSTSNYKDAACRAAGGTCDVPEFCDGKDPNCPADVLKPITTVCQAQSCINGTYKPEVHCDNKSPSCIIPADTPCSPNSCDPVAQVCLARCETSAQCLPSFFCVHNLQGEGQCMPRHGQGNQCDTSAQCDLSVPYCVDGVCCNTTCEGQCQACDVEGSKGQCVAITGDPTAHHRKACAGDGACQGSCDGAVADRCQYPDSTQSCREPSCDRATNVALEKSYCNGAGKCSETPGFSCAPYSCGAQQCQGNCSADSHCASTSFCRAGVCEPKHPVGTVCNSTAECASGFCVDGVCCDGQCSGQCESCNAAGHCQAVSGAPVGNRPACTGAGDCAGSCDGTQRNACRFPGKENSCRSASCAEGTATLSASCDGAGHCTDLPPVSCRTGCEGIVCAGNQCAVDSDCTESGTFCAANTCIPKRKAGQACSDQNECASGFCVDGLCCDSACEGQCEACDLPASLGACSSLPSGERPHGARVPCTSDGSACGGSCDGKKRSACAYPSGTLMVEPAQCKAGVPEDVATLPLRCVGTGLRPPLVQQACGDVHCSGTECGGLCANGSLACPAGQRCSAGICVVAAPPGTRCTESAQCGSGQCVDGLCCDTACSGQCEACDVAGSLGTCTPVSGAPHNGRNGCSGSGICGGQCDGTTRDSCAAAPQGTPCKAAYCGAGVHAAGAVCDGKGTCSPAKEDACPSFQCEGASCSSECQADSDCTAHYDCREGTCVISSKVNGVDSGTCGCRIPGKSESPRSLGILAFALGLLGLARGKRRSRATRNGAISRRISP